MRVIISGGGTGGHIYPGIAIAEALKKLDSENEILFIGAKGKLEMELVPAAGYHIIGLPIRGIKRNLKHLLKNIVLLLKVLVSLWRARRIIKQFKPDIVLGTGGYASFPTVYMAARMRVPVLLQEQNAHAGIVNRLLARYVDKICVAYEHMDAYFPSNKIVLTGNPVRQFLLETTDKHEASCKYFDLVPDKPTVLVLGGSQGAGMIVKYVAEAVDIFAANDIQVILSTGKAYFEKVDKQISGSAALHFKVLPYIERMDLAFAAADMVVSRAGAIAIAEVEAARKPAIFIPSPNVTADHQTKNVKPLVNRDAAIIVKDHEISKKLIPTILKLVRDNQRQQKLVENLTKYARPDAATSIVKAMKNLVRHS